jgi:hypothetical protein
MLFPLDAHKAVAMRCASLILVATAALKVATILSIPKFDVARDPVFVFLSETTLLSIVAGAEVLVSVVAAWRPLSWQAAVALFALTGCFAMYRLGLWIVGYKGGCLCLGTPMAFTSLFRNLNGDRIALVLLLYLAAVSVVALRTHRPTG